MLMFMFLAGTRSSSAVDVVYYPTTWYSPTGWVSSRAVYVPTSAYVTTGAYWPTTYATTSYVTPSVYTPTYYSPTYYYSPTSYYVETAYRPRLLDRIFAQRPVYNTSSYYLDLTPTSYLTYSPTSWAVPTVSTFDPCATTSDSFVSGGASNVAPTAATGSKAGSNGATPPRAVQSQPKANGNNGNESTGGAESDRPGEPSLDFERLSRPLPEDGAGNQGTPNTDGSTQRTSLRPRPTELSAKPTGISPSALQGEVVSATDGKPVASVRLVFTDARATYRDRQKTTDAQGRFDVILPNGDWDVSVADASGKLVPYGSITSANGRFYGADDRVISSLRLNQ
jgi:hypothetical protein